MELGAADHLASRGRLMATVTHVCTLDYVAGLLDEGPELLDAILSNSDNLTYGFIITVHTGTDEAITSSDRTDRHAQQRALTTEIWHQFLDDFVDDPELVARFQTQSPRQLPTN